MDVRISSYQAQNMIGLKQALSVSVMKKAMNQDAQSMENIIKAMESSLQPHLGQSIDMKI